MSRSRMIAIALSASLVPFFGSAAADVLTLVSANEKELGYFGYSVDGIPDVDGDGVDDVIVGASEEDGGGVMDAGRVYIHSGATGLLIRAHSSPNDTVEGGYGHSVAGLGDVNADGRGDYAVGAPSEAGPGGRVYVYSGINGALIRTTLSPNAEAGGEFGYVVTLVPDCTGDGRPDYGVGAPGENGDRGRFYVFSGQTGNLARTNNSPNAEVGGRFGHSGSGIPDTNADGRGDYIVGAPMEDPGALPSDAGKAYVFNGIDGTLRYSLTSPNAESGGRFGHSVAGTPDVGGNGSGDLIVGAPYEEVSVDNVDYASGGHAYLFSGTNGAFSQTFQAPDDELNDENLFGWAVDGMTDRDGDGLGELIVGAPGWPGYHAYVIEGNDDFSILQNFSTPDDLGANQFFGGAVAGIGDANGDGLGDWIVGARGSDEFPEGPSESGRAYIQRTTIGNNSCSVLTVDNIFDGENPFTNIGATGGGSGDLACEVAVEADVWFRYVATCTGTVIFDTCSDTNFDTVLLVYTGCAYGGSPFFFCTVAEDPIGCNNNSGNCGGTGSRVAINTVEGQCYFVRVGGNLGDQGIGTLTVTCACVGDINQDGTVSGADITEILGAWGGVGNLPEDLNNDNVVDGGDITVLLGNWGPC